MMIPKLVVPASIQKLRTDSSAKDWEGNNSLIELKSTKTIATKK